MSTDLQSLKAAVPLPELVSETHVIDRTGKCLCDAHPDARPSLQVYDDHAHCFACGWHGDHIDWLKLAYGLNTAEAIRLLERRAGGYVPPTAQRRPAPPPRTVTFKPVDATALEQHHRQADQLDRVPLAMEGRSFTLADLQHLGVAAYRDDAVFPISGPDGEVLALKRRYAHPGGGSRYRYTTPGHGTPAWCSPDFLERDTVLVIEGELNGAACWLAAPELPVMGVAGSGGALHLDALRGRTAYIYADADDPGEKARAKWAASALAAGALKVFVIEPWPSDACDIAGSEGRAALTDVLNRSLKGASLWEPAPSPLPPKKTDPRSYRARVRARMRGWASCRG